MSPERQLFAVPAAIVLVALSYLIYDLWPDEDPELFVNIKIQEVLPWSASPAAIQSAPVVDVMIDVSQPMGGFLPVAAGATSEFQDLVTQAERALAASIAAGTTATSLRRFAIAAESREGTITMVQSAFQGTQTNLSLALAAAASRLTHGEAAAALLISDLVATEGITGGQSAGAAVSALLDSEFGRRGGAVGLFAVRLAYSGVRVGKLPGCKVTPALGCWYSELANAGFRWRPLSAVAYRPVYLLLIAQDQRGIEMVRDALQSWARQRDLTTQYELLSFSPIMTASPRELSSTCRYLRAEPLRINQAGMASCLRGGVARLNCDIPIQIELGMKIAEASWPLCEEGIKGSFKIDCNSAWKSDSVLRLIMRRPIVIPAGRWDDWTTDSDLDESSLNRTLGLSSFFAPVAARDWQQELIVKYHGEQ